MRATDVETDTRATETGLHSGIFSRANQGRPPTTRCRLAKTLASVRCELFTDGPPWHPGHGLSGVRAKRRAPQCPGNPFRYAPRNTLTQPCQTPRHPGPTYVGKGRAREPHRGSEGHRRLRTRRGLCGKIGGVLEFLAGFLAGVFYQGRSESLRLLDVA